MAVYKYPQYLIQSDHQAYDAIHQPGAFAPYSGVYRCEGCGLNDVSTHGHPLPPQNHHQHSQQQGPIRWRLIVATR
jgi:hypothetical protein